MVAQNENAAPDNWKVMGDTLVTLLQKTIGRDKKRRIYSEDWEFCKNS